MSCRRRFFVWLLACLAASLAACERPAHQPKLPEPRTTPAKAVATDMPEVLVPAGEFGMGCPSPDDSRCHNQYRVVSLPAFYIDVFEVSMGQYRVCVSAGACQEKKQPPGKDDPQLPAWFVTHAEATTYCRFAGKRLPTSAEWEKAARGVAGGDYPWGDKWESTWANWCDGEACDGSVDGFAGQAPVDAFPRNVSPYGVRNLAGNMLEWTATPAPNRPGSFIVRGGSFGPNNHMAKPLIGLISWREFTDPGANAAPHVGFRCARSAGL